MIFREVEDNTTLSCWWLHKSCIMLSKQLYTYLCNYQLYKTQRCVLLAQLSSSIKYGLFESAGRFLDCSLCQCLKVWSLIVLKSVCFKGQQLDVLWLLLHLGNSLKCNICILRTVDCIHFSVEIWLTLFLVKVVKGATKFVALCSAMYMIRKKDYRPFLMTHQNAKWNLLSELPGCVCMHKWKRWNSCL